MRHQVSMISEWLRIAARPSVIRRSLRYGVLVGCILIGINYGDTILHGEVTTAGLLKMGLMAFVPYVVSTVSSVAAIQDNVAVYKSHGDAVSRVEVRRMGRETMHQYERHTRTRNRDVLGAWVVAAAFFFGLFVLSIAQGVDGRWF